MLGPASSAATTTTTTTADPATPSSPVRPSRLRGLSYLRNYTSTSRASAPTLTRAHTSPVPVRLAAVPPPAPNPPDSRAAPPQSASIPSPAPPTDHPASPAYPRDQPSMSADDSALDDSRLNRSRAETYSIGDRASDGGSRPAYSRTMSAGASELLANGDKKAQLPTIRLIPHHEARATRPSLTFPIINRTLPNDGAVIKVGRYSEKDNFVGEDSGDPDAIKPVGFKSKVVSRRHCEFWCQDGQWYIRDVKSSSGTFLNHVRLSPAATESKPYPINDGDIVQLGIDFKGGEEVIFRSVKIRVECNRNWQKSLNQFNTSTHKTIRNLASGGRKSSDAGSVSTSECSICLNPVAPCQALFVAPCSHVWHYKCIRAIIYPHWPSFQCPNCRAYADLEADVEPSDSDFDEDIPEELRHPTTDTSEDQGQTSSLAQASGPAVSSTEPVQQSTSIADPSTPLPQRSAPIAIAGTTAAPPPSFVINSAENAGLSILAGPDGPTTPRNDVGPFVLDTIASTSGLIARRHSGIEAAPNGQEGGEEGG